MVLFVNSISLFVLYSHWHWQFQHFSCIFFSLIVRCCVLSAINKSITYLLTFSVWRHREMNYLEQTTYACGRGRHCEYIQESAGQWMGHLKFYELLSPSSTSTSTSIISNRPKDVPWKDDFPSAGNNLTSRNINFSPSLHNRQSSQAKLLFVSNDDRILT